MDLDETSFFLAVRCVDADVGWVVALSVDAAPIGRIFKVVWLAVGVSVGLFDRWTDFLIVWPLDRFFDCMAVRLSDRVTVGRTVGIFDVWAVGIFD